MAEVVELREAKEATGWELEVAEELETTDPPTEKELGILRELKARTEALRNRVRRETRGEV